MTFGLAVLGGILGAAIGWAAAAFLTLAVSGYFGVSDFEGARAMGAFFGFGPIGGIVGLFSGVLLVLAKRGGSLRLREIAWKLPAVIAVIAGIVAVAFWVAYEQRPYLNSNGAAPKLVFEIRLPPGPVSAGLSASLNTEKNFMPAELSESAIRMEGDRPVISGSVEMHYRSSWRLLSLKTPDGADQLFRLNLPARPDHEKEFRAFEPVANVGEPGQPSARAATAKDLYDIRYRVVWPGEE